MMGTFCISHVSEETAEPCSGQALALRNDLASLWDCTVTQAVSLPFDISSENDV